MTFNNKIKVLVQYLPLEDVRYILCFLQIKKKDLLETSTNESDEVKSKVNTHTHTSHTLTPATTGQISQGSEVFTRISHFHVHTSVIEALKARMLLPFYKKEQLWKSASLATIKCCIRA